MTGTVVQTWLRRGANYGQERTGKGDLGERDGGGGCSATDGRRASDGVSKLTRSVGDGVPTDIWVWDEEERVGEEEEEGDESRIESGVGGGWRR